VDVGSAQDGDVCAMANIVGRMVQPGSERRTNAWLRYASALGEMLGIDFGGLSDMALYLASDGLLGYRDAIERQLCGAFMEKANFR